MKNIQIFLSIFLLTFLSYTSHGQILKKLGDKAKAKVEQRADNKVDKAMDKTLDEAEEGDKVKKDDDGDTKIKKEDGTKIKTEGDEKSKSSSSMSFTSKYDFVPGEKVVAYEDFGNAAIGDFPTRWNTNATAEVVTLNNREGKWLKINKEGVWFPEFITNLPENFTLEFDLGVSNGFDGSQFAVNMPTQNDVILPAY
jgi:methionine-rich copper-binding protein CopC